MNRLKRASIPIDVLAQVFVLGPNPKNGRITLLYIADIEYITDLNTIEVMIEEMERDRNVDGPFRIVYFRYDHKSVPVQSSVMFDFFIFQLPQYLTGQIARFAIF